MDPRLTLESKLTVIIGTMVDEIITITVIIWTGKSLKISSLSLFENDFNIDMQKLNC